MASSSARPTASRTEPSSTWSPAYESTWSSSDSASRMPPSARRAIRISAAGSAWTPSAVVIRFSLAAMTSVGESPELVALGAADDRGRDAVQIGRGQDEDDVVGRLFDQLEQRVERMRAEHVDLVDDVDPAAQFGRCGESPEDEITRVLDQSVRGSVDLDHVHGPPFADRHAGGAVVARLPVVPALEAVDGLGQDAGGGRLAGSARTHEEVRMDQAVGRNRAAQGVDDGVLADHLAEALGSPTAVQGAARTGHRGGRIDRWNGGDFGLGIGWHRRLGAPWHDPPTLHGRRRIGVVAVRPASSAAPRTRAGTRLQPGRPTALDGDRLPLLPSGSDGVRGPPLRGTRLSTSGAVVGGGGRRPQPGCQPR